LARCLRRAAAIPRAAAVLVTLPEAEIGDGLAREAAAHGAVVIREGEDALARAAIAVKAVEAQSVVALRADQVFFDPVIAMGVKALLDDSKADFACNTRPAGFPDGLDCAAFPSALLFEADKTARSAQMRSDAVSWMTAHDSLIKANLNGPGGGLERLRWRLSSQADFDFAEAVCEAMGPRVDEAGAAELAGLCLRRPDLAAINAGAANHWRAEAAPATLQSRPVRFGLAA
jgi:spore coat polysaccharide biosynthesis protein SpsF